MTAKNQREYLKRRAALGLCYWSGCKNPRPSKPGGGLYCYCALHAPMRAAMAKDRYRRMLHDLAEYRAIKRPMIDPGMGQKTATFNDKRGITWYQV